MQRKWMYVAAMSVFLLLAQLLSGAGVAAAHDPDVPAGFSAASIAGNYALTQYDANSGAVGLCNFDGESAFTCSFTVNAPGKNKDRMEIPLTSTGTYTLTDQGIGIALEEQKLPDGSTSNVVNLVSVSDAKAIGHNLLATQLQASFPDGNGGMAHALLTRLPDTGSAEGGFSNASVDGAYALSSPFGPGFAGICHMDGAGSFVCDFTVGFPDEKGSMQTLSLSNSGEYTVTSDGMGVVHFVNSMPDGTTQEGYDDFVVSGAEAEGPFAVVNEITDLSRDPADENGGLNVTILHRLPDLADTSAISSSENMTDTTGQ